MREGQPTGPSLRGKQADIAHRNATQAQGDEVHRDFRRARGPHPGEIPSPQVSPLRRAGNNSQERNLAVRWLMIRGEAGGLSPSRESRMLRRGIGWGGAESPTCIWPGRRRDELPRKT